MSIAETQNPAYFSKLEKRVALLEQRLGAIQITTFAPEPYLVKRPIPVSIQEDSGEFLASFMEANINTSGGTPQEAFANLRELILDTFDDLATLEPTQLGPKPRRQLAILKEYLRAPEDHQRTRPQDH